MHPYGPVQEIVGLHQIEDPVIVADGHDFNAILDAFAQAKQPCGQPVMILFRTDMGHGIDFMAGTHKWHGKAPSAEQCEAALAQLGTTALGDF